MVVAPNYNLLILGEDNEHQRRKLQDQLTERMKDLELDKNLIKIIQPSAFWDEEELNKYPLLVLYFGYKQSVLKILDPIEGKILEKLNQDSTQIVPIVHDLSSIHRELPEVLWHINAMRESDGESRLVNLILESFRLLRQERRLFISYKRSESSSIAAQLYDVLDARGFDVFLDSRSVPFGVDFQEVLWHRMADSDIVVLIDSLGFRKSPWTIKELNKANETNIQIIHLLYPNQEEDQESAFSHFIPLEEESYISNGDSKILKPKVLEEIVFKIEEKRARALASRYRYLVDNFCDQCDTLNIKNQIQPEGHIIVGKGDISNQIFVIPAIGIPDSQLLYTYHSGIHERGFDKEGVVWVIYDNRGVMKKWIEHLSWLDKHLPIHTVSMLYVGDKLKQEFL